MFQFQHSILRVLLTLFAVHSCQAFHPMKMSSMTSHSTRSSTIPNNNESNRRMIPSKIVSTILIPSLWGLGILSSSLQPVMAVDIQQGSKVFTQSCVMCHANGGNAIAKQRDLSKEAMDQYIGLNVPSINTFIHDSTVHRGALAFSGKLTDADYENVAAYVYDQAMGSKW